MHTREETRRRLHHPLPATLIVTPLAFGFCLFLAGCAGPSEGAGHSGAMGNPLGGLERLKNFETRRASSCQPDWRNANSDNIPILAGETATLAELEGPGKIVHIWLTISHPDPHYANQLTLRIYWDGESHPSVEAPVGDFFGVGHGLDRPFASLPIRVTAEGRARNCYWPMPFRKSARITISNESALACRGLYYYIDWQKHPALPDDAAYFHAMYRQEFPCVMGRNYLLADIRGRGHYVGTVQSVYLTSDGWYGEGDDFFFIDGVPEPILRGTGTEDYFCDAWGFRAHEGPFYGVTVYEGRSAGNRSTAYRFHLPDPVAFRKSLRVEIEHKGSQTFGGGQSSGFIERDDLFSSVAYWYQTEPHQPWPVLPAGPERIPYREQLVFVGTNGLQTARHSGQPLQVQTLRGRTPRHQLWFKPEAAGAWIEIPFQTDHALTGDLLVRVTRAPDYGRYRVSLDGRFLAQFDGCAPTVQPLEVFLGRQNLAAGAHVIRFECEGRNEASRGHLLGFENVSMRIPRYLRPAGKDLRDLQVR